MQELTTQVDIEISLQVLLKSKERIGHLLITLTISLPCLDLSIGEVDDKVTSSWIND